MCPFQKTLQRAKRGDKIGLVTINKKRTLGGHALIKRGHMNTEIGIFQRVRGFGGPIIITDPGLDQAHIP